MRILVVSDLHGRTHQIKLAYEKFTQENFDKIVFLGDYVDSFFLPIQDCIDTLNAVIRLKKQFPNKVTMLLGNHDWQYLFYPYVGQCSGFNFYGQPSYQRIFQENLQLFKVAYMPTVDSVFSHAGITKKFLGNANLRQFVSRLNTDSFTANARWINQTHGCLWVRPDVLNNDYIEGVTQVVGHTQIEQIVKFPLKENTQEKQNFIYYTDVLAKSDRFLKLTVS